MAKDLSSNQLRLSLATIQSAWALMMMEYSLIISCFEFARGDRMCHSSCSCSHLRLPAQSEAEVSRAGSMSCDWENARRKFTTLASNSKGSKCGRSAVGYCLSTLRPVVRRSWRWQTFALNAVESRFTFRISFSFFLNRRKKNRAAKSIMTVSSRGRMCCCWQCLRIRAEQDLDNS